ncbi:MAG: helix-turn-helix transcriptional regulator [Novosphingobium sp.]|nr:helix-turn-helix transcriptional regulator [Novosphingobium sp.]
MELNASSTARGSNETTPSLSKRQLACLELAAEGLTSKEIARRMRLSPSTVDNHIRAASARLGANGRREAVRLLKHGASAAPEGSGMSKDGPEIRSFPLVPPLGGARNQLSVPMRLTSVFQVMLMGTAVMAATLFTISGLIEILSR